MRAKRRGNTGYAQKADKKMAKLRIRHFVLWRTTCNFNKKYIFDFTVVYKCGFFRERGSYILRL